MFNILTDGNVTLLRMFQGESIYLKGLWIIVISRPEKILPGFLKPKLAIQELERGE